jgi:hypothetical protein
MSITDTKTGKTYQDTPKNRRARQRKRREQLNEAAVRIGFDSWSKFETAVINGEYVLKQ